MKMYIKNHYIGPVTIESLRNFIIDTSIDENNVLYLHSITFDDIVIQHRLYFDKPLVEPFLLLGVTVVEDFSGRVPIQRVGVSDKF